MSALSRVVIPDPDQPPLGLTLTCGIPECRHTFTPDPVDFAGRLRCPACGGWTFTAALLAEGGDR